MSWSRLYTELGPDGYPPEWHATIKHAVREAAGHRCVRCGHPYRSGEHGRGEWTPCDEQCEHGGPLRARRESPDWTPYEHESPGAAMAGRLVAGGMEVHAAWRILTVHHLDGNKANCRWWNLAALCQRCHLQIQGKVVMDRRWPHEHSPWFRPYVAGYYAHVYLGADLTREQAVERVDELLALEHRQLGLEVG